MQSRRLFRVAQDGNVEDAETNSGEEESAMQQPATTGGGIEMVSGVGLQAFCRE